MDSVEEERLALDEEGDTLFEGLIGERMALIFDGSSLHDEARS